MAEELTLTDPVTKPSTISYKVDALELVISSLTIKIVVLDNTGQILTFYYSGQTARDYITFINKGNFATTSLQKRILQRLVQEGKLPPGNVTGVPE